MELLAKDDVLSRSKMARMARLVAAFRQKYREIGHGHFLRVLFQFTIN
jgi:hypothetical protein